MENFTCTRRILTMSILAPTSCTSWISFYASSPTSLASPLLLFKNITHGIQNSCYPGAHGHRAPGAAAVVSSSSSTGVGIHDFLPHSCWVVARLTDALEISVSNCLLFVSVVLAILEFAMLPGQS